MKELIILGRGPSWRDCPFDAEVWTIASSLLIPELRDVKFSKVFAFDPSGREPERTVLPIARENGLTIVSTKPYATEKYPLAEIRKEFCNHFLRNSISHMIAYALYLGYEKLRLYGIDQGPEWEYIAGRPYTLFWLGVATGRGVAFELAKTSLLDHPLREHIKKRVKEITARGEWDKIAEIERSPVFISGEGVSVSISTQGELR